jgi:hypothetical protein
MQYPKNTGFADRMTAASEAKKAMLARFQPKPTVIDPNLVDREARRAAEREAVRVARQAEKEEAQAARAARAEAARQAALLDNLAILEAKKAERKERKQNMKQDAQQRRAERLSAYARA